MSVISSFPAMPNRIAIACEYIFSLGVDGGQRDEILKNLSPLSNGDGEDDNEVASSGKTMAHSVIDEMENLELVLINENSNLILAKDFLSAKKTSYDWQSLLQPILRERLTDSSRASQFRQDDVGDALSWFLSQDPFKPIAKSRQHADFLREQLQESDPLLITIGNDSRFQNLLYWARYLGFSEWISIGDNDLAIPDPTRAINYYLPTIFQSQKSLAIGEFVSRLAKACGIFEGGPIRQELEQRLKSAIREERHFSRSTSLGLARLENQGLILLKKESDAGSWILDLGKEQMPITSIDYLAKARK